MAAATMTDPDLDPATDAEVLDALASPIDPNEIRTKDGANGKQLRFVKPAAVRNRLNTVLGRAGWESKLTAVAAGPDQSPGYICYLTVHLPSGRSVTRAGVGGCPRMSGPDGPENSTKGGATDAFKLRGGRVRDRR